MNVRDPHLAIGMDKSTKPVQAAAREHHHSSPDLPRPWITLPPSVVSAARTEPRLRALFPSHVGFFPKARGHRVQRPAIHSTILNYCADGLGWCELHGRAFAVEPGDIMVVPSGTPHAYAADAANPWSIYWFHAMGETLPDLLGELRVSREHPVVHVGRHPELVALFVELRQTLEADYCQPNLLYASRVLTYLFGVMIRKQREAKRRDTGDTLSQIQRTIEHMVRHSASAVAVETLASMAGLSTSHYTARFRELTGFSPKNYLIRLRMHRAAQLLGTTRESVSSIARHVGYEDPLYFSKTFRRSHDASPSEYRKAHQQR
jgi:AraC-like DNA-binding protein